MNSRSEACDKLYKARELASPEQVSIFEEVVVDLQDEGSIKSLQCLLRAFDDSTQQKEVMWSLVHAVEDFDLDTYVSELVVTIPSMIGHAREWMLTLLKRILSTEKTLKILQKTLEKLSDSKRQNLRELLLEAALDDDKLTKTAHSLFNN